MAHFLAEAGQSLLLAVGMGWKVAWSLILGFALSALLQDRVPPERIRRVLGGDGVMQAGLALGAGALSSSCSYAAASVSSTLFRKGAGLVPCLAFLLGSTNLVIELGIILYLLMGWPFMAAEWMGGVLMAGVMVVLVRATYPKRWAEAARRHDDETGHHHAATRQGPVRQRVARAFVMECSMMWKDMAAGFLIAGCLMVFVPASVWPGLFRGGVADALIGPLVAVITFVCSIGNVPMAAVLWSSGVGFSGVLAFLYGDLIVLPLLDVYRRQYGLKMAAYIGAVLYVSMVLAAIAAGAVFSAAGWVPAQAGDVRARIGHFAFDYTFWLNLAFGALAIWLVIEARRTREPDAAPMG